MAEAQNPVELYNIIKKDYHKDGGFDYSGVCSFIRNNKQTAFPTIRQEIQILESLAQHPPNIRKKALDLKYQNIIADYESLQKQQNYSEEWRAEKELFSIYFNCISNKF